MPAAVVESLHSLLVPVANIMLLENNARIGDVRRVAKSLDAFGQRKPIVCRRTGTDEQGRPTGTVIAGNHTYKAAVDELGWDRIAAVWTDDDDATAKAYALADNRTGEIATWDLQQLSEDLSELVAVDWDMSNLGWYDHELEPLLNIDWTPSDVEGDLEDFENPKHKEKPALIVGFDKAQANVIEQLVATVREQAGDDDLSTAACIVWALEQADLA